MTMTRMTMRKMRRLRRRRSAGAGPWCGVKHAACCAVHACVLMPCTVQGQVVATQTGNERVLNTHGASPALPFGTHGPVVLASHARMCLQEARERKEGADLDGDDDDDGVDYTDYRVGW